MLLSGELSFAPPRFVLTSKLAQLHCPHGIDKFTRYFAARGAGLSDPKLEQS
jgi:hypothetical protein